MARSIYEYMNQQLPQMQQPQINVYGQQAAQMPFLNLGATNRNLNSREGSAYSTEEERVLLDKLTEDQLRERATGTNEYKQWLDAQTKLQSLQNQYADYLESRKEKDKDLRNAAIIGRTMAAVTGDKSWGDIVQEPLTEEQKIATRLGFLKNEAGDLKERMGFISDERKNQLLGKSSVKYGARDVNLNENTGNIRGTNVNPHKPAGPRQLTRQDMIQQEKIGQKDAQVQSMRDLVADLDSIRNRYPEGKIPGSGIIGSATPGWVDSMIGSQASLDAVAVKNILTQIAATKVYDLSGKAVTVPEFERTKAAVAGGKFNSYKEFNRALNAFIESYDRAQARYYSGFQPENIDAVRKRTDQSLPKGPPTSGVEDKKEPPKESAIQRRRREEAQKLGTK